MSIYIGNDLEDRLKALEIENASLVVSISNQWISITTSKLRNGMILQ